MINWFRNHFRDPTTHEMVARELADAYREKLKYETMAEYALSKIDFNTKRIVRLEGYSFAKAQYQE